MSKAPRETLKTVQTYIKNLQDVDIFFNKPVTNYLFGTYNYKIVIMIRLLLFSVIMVAQTAVNAQTVIIEDKNAEPRVASGFNKIDVKGGIEVILAQANEEGLAVSVADKSLLSQIETKVSDSVLYVTFKDDHIKSVGNKLKVYISFINLKKINISGYNSVQIVNPVKFDKLDIDLKGASDFKGDITAEQIRIKISGACNFKASGSTDVFKLDISGACSLNISEMLVNTCYVDAKGASDMLVNVSEKLEGNLKGVCLLKYKGNPSVVDVKASVASDVKRTETKINQL